MRLLKWTYAALALLMMQSCLSGSYEGVANDLFDQGEKVPVNVEVGDPSGGILIRQDSPTKGFGPIDNISQVEGKDIYVYAFRNDMFTSYAKTSVADNVNTLVDGSIDRKGSLAGKKARTTGSMSLDWVESSTGLYYHSSDMKHVPYEFYAYYLDDLQVPDSDYTRTDDAVSLKVQIDGRTDLMSAKAELLQEQLENCPEEEREYAREYSYSYYTAIRNIHPRFYLKHHLARFEFELLPGHTPGGAAVVQVVSVKVESKYKADFVVAEKSHPSQLGLRFEDEYTTFTLAEPDGSPIPEDKYSISTLPNSVGSPESIPIGGSLLLAPQDEAFTAYIKLRGVKEDGKVYEMENQVKITYDNDGDSQMFAAGNKYKVKFPIYGVTNVSASVTMEKWTDGGNLDVDTENDKPNLTNN